MYLAPTNQNHLSLPRLCSHLKKGPENHHATYVFPDFEPPGGATQTGFRISPNNPGRVILVGFSDYSIPWLKENNALCGVLHATQNPRRPTTVCMPPSYVYIYLHLSTTRLLRYSEQRCVPTVMNSSSECQAASIGHCPKLGVLDPVPKGPVGGATTTTQLVSTIPKSKYSVLVPPVRVPQRIYILKKKLHS